MAGSAKLAKPLNVLWLMTDEQRCDSLGCLGSAWARTPRLDALADRSALYTAAYTPSPVCVPARVAQLTGYHPSTCGVYTIHDPLPRQRARFLTQNFAQAGYQTASFGKQHYNSEHRKAFDHESFRVVGDRVKPTGYVDPADELGADVVRYPGEDEASRWVLAGRLPGTIDDMPEAQVVNDACAWLTGRDPDQPFFLRLSFNGPHTPVVAPRPFDTIIDPDAIDLPIDRHPGVEPTLPNALRQALVARSGTHRLTDAQVRRARQAYYGLVAALDELIGRVLDTLNDSGLADSTIVAFCSDHGTHLGDHGFFQKQSFFEPSVKVPFMIAVPGRDGVRVETPVSTGSLLPTLLARVGLPVPEDVEYPTLASAVGIGDDEPNRPIVSEIGYGKRGGRPGDRYAMVRHDRFKLTVFRDRSDPDRLPPRDGLMLFDLQDDPDERTNLADSPDHDATILSLLDDLAQHDADPRRFALADARRTAPAGAA